MTPANSPPSCVPLGDLTRAVLAIPTNSRGAVVRATLAFDPGASVAESFDVGALRAAFAAYWEARFDAAVPIVALRSLLQPPLPIKTVMAFSLLGVVQGETQVEQAIVDLVEHLHKRIATECTPGQPTLIDLGRCDDPKCTPSYPVGKMVRRLSELVDEGKQFSTVYADPPWNYDNRASRAAAANHYETMTLDDICAEPVEALAAVNAHLHLWTTSGFLKEAFEVIDAWGFEYKSSFVWVKDDIGMGNYWRLSHEFLLLGVRGNLRFRDRTLRSWIRAARTEHSRKPGIVRTLIEQASPGPYLELYGREELRDSAWTVYGNQIERRLF